MRTPAGKECQYFYGDYYRGRNQEECRLLSDAKPPLEWKPELCKQCPVPEFLLANACSHMMFEPQLDRLLPFTKKRVRVQTYCTKTHREKFDAHVGCGECHNLPAVFSGLDRE